MLERIGGPSLGTKELGQNRFEIVTRVAVAAARSLLTRHESEWRILICASRPETRQSQRVTAGSVAGIEITGENWLEIAPEVAVAAVRSLDEQDDAHGFLFKAQRRNTDWLYIVADN